MVEALALIKRYEADVPGRVKCYTAREHVPVDGIIPAELAELMYQGDGKRAGSCAPCSAARHQQDRQQPAQPPHNTDGSNAD